MFSRTGMVSVFDLNRDEGDMMIFESNSFESADAIPSLIAIITGTTKLMIISEYDVSIYNIGNCILDPDDCR